MASNKTAATPVAMMGVKDVPFFGWMGSRGEPHSGQRNSLVTTLIFSFRYASLQPE
jgi:hypothetical protein